MRVTDFRPIICCALVMLFSSRAAIAEDRFDGLTARQWFLLLRHAPGTTSDAVLTRLVRVRPAALPVFSRILRSPDASMRQLGAKGLAELGPLAAPLVPDIVEALRKAQPAEVRRELILALGRMGQAAAASATVLEEHFGRAGFEVAAARALACVQPASERAWSALGAALSGEELTADTRWAILQTIERGGSRATPAIRGLCRFLGGPCKPVELRMGCEALLAIGVCNGLSRTPLRRGLGHSDVRTRVVAAGALATLNPLGPDRRRSVELLRECLAGTDEYARIRAASFLWTMNDRVLECRRVLDAAIRGPNRWQKLEAIRGTERVGMPARRLASVIVECAANDDPAIRAAAGCAVWSMTHDRERVRPLLKSAIDGGYFVGCQKAWALLQRLPTD